MVDQQWRARVASEDGKILGTGFLIDATHVMTCAHVIGDKTLAVVTFPGSSERSSHTAEVCFRGPWTPCNDFGDIAVLALESAVGISPARFAQLHALEQRRLGKNCIELHVYGFPRGFDQEGADTRVTAPYQSLHMGEWAQLEAVGSRGIRLQAGFSGAAVTFADTGDVVGMVIGADKDQQTMTGKMLPLQRMCDYWEPLADLIPLGLLPLRAWNELRELLAEVSPKLSPDRLYVASLPDGLGPAPPRFASLWDTARFLAIEVDATSDQPLARFCSAVADCVGDPALRSNLSKWRDRYFPGTAPPSASVRDRACPAEVDVQLIRSGDPGAFTLTITTVVDGVATPIYQDKVLARRVRYHVERKLPDAIRHIPPDLDLIIEFELPLSWLNKPVDEWYADPQERYPLGWLYPVVVRNVPSVNSSDRSRRIGTRWQTLSTQRSATLYPIDCRDSRDHFTLTAWLLASADRTVLALAKPPTNPGNCPALRAGLYAGVPVMLWRRQSCNVPHSGIDLCSGDRFLVALREALANVRPAQLPEAVRTLRAKSVGNEDETWGRALTLFWDDPRRRRNFDAPLELAD